MFLVAMIMLPVQGFAADGSSGCGPAWYIFKDNSLVSSFLRGFTNGVSSPVVTLGMTFGTSNCAQHKIVEATKRSEHLATVGLERLRLDAARGEGSFLEAYAETFSCDAATIPEFKTAVQLNYDRIFSHDAAPGAIVESTKAVLRQNSLLTAGCGSV
jgi:hypothetical protein